MTRMSELDRGPVLAALSIDPNLRAFLRDGKIAQVPARRCMTTTPRFAGTWWTKGS